METFRAGSPLHFACLAVCLLVSWIFLRLIKRAKTPERQKPLRWFVGIGCLAVWGVSVVTLILSGPFDWRTSLPLEICNLANLVGAVAVLGRVRLFQSILYFWSLALCIWAFLTPVLYHGPAYVVFWIFWIYHLFIILAVIDVLAVQRFRPDWKDFGRAWLATIFYAGFLAVMANRFGWDYGFVGPTKPANPTLIDALGSYPLRLLWMGLIGTTLFALLVLPWRGRRTSEA